MKNWLYKIQKNNNFEIDLSKLSYSGFWATLLLFQLDASPSKYQQALIRAYFISRASTYCSYLDI